MNIVRKRERERNKRVEAKGRSVGLSKVVVSEAEKKAVEMCLRREEKGRESKGCGEKECKVMECGIRRAKEAWEREIKNS